MFAGAGFGQFGISKNRAIVLLRFAHLSEGPDQPAGKDAYWFIDGPLGEFNEHMASKFRSGYLGCMDETGPMWRGAEGEGTYDKCPHVQVCHRKPEPVCAQLNDSGCAQSRVMCHVEYEKAAAYHPSSRQMEIRHQVLQCGDDDAALRAVCQQERGDIR